MWWHCICIILRLKVIFAILDGLLLFVVDFIKLHMAGWLLHFVFHIYKGNCWRFFHRGGAFCTMYHLNLNSRLGNYHCNFVSLCISLELNCRSVCCTRRSRLKGVCRLPKTAAIHLGHGLLFLARSRDTPCHREGKKSTTTRTFGFAKAKWRIRVTAKNDCVEVTWWNWSTKRNMEFQRFELDKT